MNRTEIFRGRDTLVTGDRRFVLQSLPPDAQVLRAVATVVPVDSSGNEGPSRDVITFTGTEGTSGETKRTTSDSVEVDFHGRRLLDSVAGTDLDGAEVLVDMGGAFVSLDTNGAFLAPGGSELTLGSTTGLQSLPGVSVARLRLFSNNPLLSPDISEVQVLHIASNISMAIEGEAPFWVYPGELVARQMSVDFSAVLQAALIGAEALGGFAQLPLIVHSDSLARLDVLLDIEFVSRKNALPAELSDVKLGFSFAGSSDTDVAPVTVAVPQGSRLVASATSAKVVGQFDNAKIVHGPLKATPLGNVDAEVSPQIAVAQSFVLEDDITLSDVDVLVRSNVPTSNLAIDLRGDLDGKPDSESLLANPVEFSINSTADAEFNWVNVELGADLKLLALEEGVSARYWLVVQSRDGNASVGIQGVSNQTLPLPLQATTDGGLSWRAHLEAIEAGPAQLLFRLRQRLDRFRLPLSVKVGEGENEVTLGLEQYEPLGRIDFAVDGELLADAVNEFVAAQEKDLCPKGEQLINGDFALVVDLGSEVFVPSDWEITGGSVLVLGDLGLQLGADTQDSGISQLLPVSGDCEYLLTVVSGAQAEGSRVELVWRSAGCSVERIDVLEIEIFDSSTAASSGFIATAQRLRVQAPSEVNQLEIRALVPANTATTIHNLSLEASAQSLQNPDFRETAPESRLHRWEIEPATVASEILVSRLNNETQLNNNTALVQPVNILQEVSVTEKQAYNLLFEGSAISESGVNLQVSFLDVAGSPLHVEERSVTPASSQAQELQGVVPAQASVALVGISLESGAGVSIANLSFESLAVNEVPLEFLSEAPGDLSLSDFKFGVEQGQPRPPLPLPDGGLCRATPAGLSAEDDCEKNDCPHCAEPQRLINPQAVITSGGRPATVFTCATCETPILILGGTLIPGSPLFHARHPVTVTPFVDSLPLTEVNLVGPAREAVLNENNIFTMSDLALASPELLVDVLNISDELAARFVEEAKTLSGIQV